MDQSYDEIPRYRLRKLTIGFVSVMFVFLIFTGVNSVANADTISQSSNIVANVGSASSAPQSGVGTIVSSSIVSNSNTISSVSLPSSSTVASQALTFASSSSVNQVVATSSSVESGLSLADQVVANSANSDSSFLNDQSDQNTDVVTSNGSFSSNLQVSSELSENATGMTTFNVALLQVNVAMPASVEASLASSQDGTFNINDWSYNQDFDSDGPVITLQRYKGHEATVYVPNAADFATKIGTTVNKVTISADLMTKIANTSTTRKIVVSNKDGKKVTAISNSYDLKDPAHAKNAWMYVFGSKDNQVMLDGRSGGLVTNYNLTDLDLSGLDVSKVPSIAGLFSNPHLKTITGINNWDVSHVVNFGGAFYNAKSLQGSFDLSKWNTSSAIDMGSMFNGAESLTSIGDLSKWNLSKVQDIGFMFNDTKGLASVGDLSNWNTGHVTTMRGMFQGTGLVDIGNIGKWDVSKVTDMGYMFSSARMLINIGDLSSWNVGNVRDMESMFQAVFSLQHLGQLDDWNVSKVTSMSRMFNGSSKLLSVGNLSKWNPLNVTDMSRMFMNASSLTNLGNLDNWNTGSVKDMSFMFYGTSDLSNVGNLSKWNVGNVLDMTAMFNDAKSLPTVGNLDNWNTAKVTNMQFMFSGDSVLTNIGDLSKWKTGNVISFGSMFQNAPLLTSIGKLDNWDTSKVTNMSYMFNGAKALTDLGNISNWQTGNVTTTAFMFNGDGNLRFNGQATVDISKWDLLKDTNVSSMFFSTMFNKFLMGHFRLPANHTNFMNGSQVATVVITDDPAQFTDDLFIYTSGTSSWRRQPYFDVEGAGAKITGYLRAVVAMTQSDYDKQTSHIKSVLGKIVNDNTNPNYYYYATYKPALADMDTNGADWQATNVLAKMVDGTFNKDDKVRVSLPKNSQGFIPASGDIPFTTFTLVNQNTVTYRFVDDDNNGSSVGTDVVVSGNSGDSVKTNLKVPDNYELVTGQTLPDTVTIPDTASVVKIHLKHQIETLNDGHANITVKIVVHYQDNEDSTKTLVPDTVINMGFHRDYSVDKVTNKATFGSWNYVTNTLKETGTNIDGLKDPTGPDKTAKEGFDSFKLWIPYSVKVDGYHALYTGLQYTESIISKEGIISSGPDGEATVGYLKNDQVTTDYQDRTIRVHFQDDTGKVLSPDAVLKVRYQRTKTVYMSGDKKGQTAYGDWSFVGGNYSDDGYMHGMKVVSGVWTLPSSWNNIFVKIPTIDGYDVDTIGGSENVNHVPVNAFVYPIFDNSKAFTDTETLYEAKPVRTIVYHAQTHTVTYQFKTDDGRIIGTQDVSGKFGTSQSVELNVPVQYRLKNTSDKNQLAKFGDKDSIVVIPVVPLSHELVINYIDLTGKVVSTSTINGQYNQKVDLSISASSGYKLVDQTIPTNYTFGDFNDELSITVTPLITFRSFMNSSDVDLFKTVTRTINVTMPDKKVKTIVQSVKFGRNAWTDEASGQVTYGSWVAINGNEFYAYVPTLINGYVGQAVKAMAVDSNSSNLTVSVGYTLVSVTVHHSYIDMNGQTYDNLPADYQVVTGQVPADGSMLIVKKTSPVSPTVPVYVTRTVTIVMPNGHKRIIRQRVRKGTMFGRVAVPHLHGYKIQSTGNIDRMIANGDLVVTVTFVK